MIVVFGSINIDFVTRVTRLPGVGETVPGLSFAVYPGGKGANQALAAARAGASTWLAGAVGRDAFAEPALAMVAAAEIDLSCVSRVEGPTGCATILVSDAGENMIVSVPGANAAADAGTVPDSLLTAASTVALQNELTDTANQALIARARRNGSRIVLNVSPWRTLSRETLCTLDYIVLNEHEADALAADSNWPRGPHDLAVVSSTAIRDLTVIVTLGARGAIAARAGKLLRAEAPAVDVIDTTGAGDAFMGTLIATLDAQVPLDEALRCAVIAGSLACTVAGAQPSFPDRSVVDSMRRRINAPMPYP